MELTNPFNWFGKKKPESSPIVEEKVNNTEEAVSKRSVDLTGSIPVLMGNAFTWGGYGYAAYNNKIFYTGLNILVRKLTEVPITFSKVKAVKDDVGKKLTKFYSRSISNEERYAIKQRALTELEDHELNKLFDAPNDYQSGIEMMEDFWYNYGFGDGYLFFENLGDLSRNKKPIAIHSLPARRVMPMRSQDRYRKIEYYTFTTWNGEKIDIPTEQILHLRHWNPDYGQLRGLGVDVIAGMDIGLNRGNNVAQGAAFVNGGRGTLFSGDVISDGQGDLIEKITTEQMQKLKDTIHEELAGAENNRKMYFTNGKVEVNNYGDTLAEMEMTKTEEAQWKNIFAIIGVPWALAPITSAATDNNVEGLYKYLVTNTCIPELRKFDQKLQIKISQWWPGIIPITDLTEYSELAPDLKLMKEVYGTPSISEDERRLIFGYDELPDGLGKVILVGTNLMQLQDVGNDDFKDTPNPDDEYISEEL